MDNISQVDLVEGYEDIKSRIQTLSSVELPETKLCDVMTLEVKGELLWLAEHIVNIL